MMATDTDRKGFRQSVKELFLGSTTPVRSGTMPSLFPPAEVAWSKKEIKESRQFAYKHIDVARNSYEGKKKNAIRSKNKYIVGKDKPYKCGPSCQEDHIHNFEYDFTKNFNDPVNKRPGIDFILDPKIKVEMKKGVDPSLVEFGKKQTPINLSSQMEIKEDFQDKEFEFAYDTVESN